MDIAPWTRVQSRRRFLLTSTALSAAVVTGKGFPARAEDVSVTLPTLNEEMERALRDPPLSMLFHGSSSAELKTWQQEFAAKLRELIGPHQPPERWSTRKLSTALLPDHTREEWLLTAEGVPSLPLYVLRPRQHERDRFPIVLALHGHGSFGHDAVVGVDTTPEHIEAIQTANYDYGRQLVREGYLVVAPCFTPFGRRLSEAQRKGKTDPCAVALVRMLFLGQTLLGANLRDVIWSLEYAVRRPDVWADRVACVGLSYGGRMTMVASALEPRIKAAVISGALNLFQERALGGSYSCGAQVIPGLLRYGDTPEIGSLIAPRPCIWEVGSRDPLIVPGWSDRAIERLQAAYAASGKPEHLEFHRFEGGHQWSGLTALPLLRKILKPM